MIEVLRVLQKGYGTVELPVKSAVCVIVDGRALLGNSDVITIVIASWALSSKVLRYSITLKGIGGKTLGSILTKEDFSLTLLPQEDTSSGEQYDDD